MWKIVGVSKVSVIYIYIDNNNNNNNKKEKRWPRQRQSSLCDNPVLNLLNTKHCCPSIQPL